MDQPESNQAFGIIDSHIHLYASSHIPSLAWTSSLPPNHVLNRQNSVAEYQAAVNPSPSQLYGFIFLETDRTSGLSENQWTDVFSEIDFLLRIATGSPLTGEGHEPRDKNLVLGIVPWAPLPADIPTLSKYVTQVRQRFLDAGESTHLLKGFRYLVQDKPPRTMTSPQFIESLIWLGQQPERFTFDLGVDAHSGGTHQLREAVEMLHRLNDSPNPTKIIINHFCKPNLRLSRDNCLSGHPEFTEWADLVDQMASFPYTYMKLSGFFSELPPQKDEMIDARSLLMHVKPWLDVVFRVFGPERIMFGSDWPVCNVGGPGIEKSWRHWFELVSLALEDQGLDQKAKERIWAGTAAEAYGILLPVKNTV